MQGLSRNLSDANRFAMWHPMAPQTKIGASFNWQRISILYLRRGTLWDKKPETINNTRTFFHVILLFWVFAFQLQSRKELYFALAGAGHQRQRAAAAWLLGAKMHSSMASALWNIEWELSMTQLENKKKQLTFSSTGVLKELLGFRVPWISLGRSHQIFDLRGVRSWWPGSSRYCLCVFWVSHWGIPN